MDIADVEVKIRMVCSELCDFLIEKNRSYGNASAEPVHIFSDASVEERICVRLDDKLNRIMNGAEFDGDDTEKDIIGYLILKRVLNTME